MKNQLFQVVFTSWIAFFREEVFPREAAAVGIQAVKDGVARINRSHDELLEAAYAVIERARNETKGKMTSGIIPKAPKGTSLG